MKQGPKRAIGGIIVLSVLGLWLGQVAFLNTAQAQRDEAQGYVLSATEGEKLVFRGGEIFIKVDPATGSNNVALGTQRVLVGGRIPVHRHTQMDEVFYVVEGGGTFLLNDARLGVEKGSTIYVPKNAWHGFDKGEKEMLLLWAVAPPGLEGMFREIASRPGEPPKQFSPEQLKTHFQRHGGTEFK